MNQESRENLTNPNLLNNLEQTIELIKGIEGESWYRNHLKDVEALVEKLKKLAGSNIEPQVVMGTIYGDGGVTRWQVMASGDVAFSTFHDTGDGEKTKTKKAVAAGFKLI